MRDLTLAQQNDLQGGWGFLCGAALVMAIGASVASGAAMAGPAFIVAEWACVADVVVVG